VASVQRRTIVGSAVAAGALALAAVVAVAVNAGDSSSDPVPADPRDESDAAARTTPDRPEPDPPWLLPDMRSLDARDLQIVGTGDNRRLRFAAWLANEGPGPLLLEPRGGGPACPPGQRPADQILHRDTADDGVFQRPADPPRHQFPVGCMVDHQTHDHWHFDAMARYELTSVGGSELAAQDKVSFCLRDNTRIPGANPAQRREYFGECARNSPQGISPGWVDVYDVDTPGQSLGLPPGTSTGVYCLTLEADPHDQLREVDEADNATTIAVRIAGTNVRRADPGRCAPPG
jgi:Lysyl oxidase